MEAQVLHDPEGVVARLQAAADEIIKQGKPPLTAEMVQYTKFDAEDALKVVEAMIDTDILTAT